MEQIGSDGFDALHLDWLAVLWQQWLHGLSGHQLGWVPCQLVVVEVTVDNLVDDWILVWLLEQWPVLPCCPSGQTSSTSGHPWPCRTGQAPWRFSGAGSWLDPWHPHSQQKCDFTGIIAEFGKLQKSKALENCRGKILGYEFCRSSLSAEP